MIPIRFYLYAALLVMIVAGGWRVHHAIDKAGYERGIAEQKEAYAPALAQLGEAMKANGEWETVANALKTAVDRCQQGRVVDAEAAKKAIDAATASRERIAAEFGKSKRMLADRMAGECRDWAKAPACGSMQ